MAPGPAAPVDSAGRGRDLVRSATRDVPFSWAVGLGIGLIVIGLLGFVPNPIVGEPSASGSPLLVTGHVHDTLHLVAGAVALYAAFGLTGVGRADLLIALGVAFVVFVLLTFVSGDLLGILRYGVSPLDHLVHLAIGGISIAVGYLGRGGSWAAIRESMRRTGDAE